MTRFRTLTRRRAACLFSVSVLLCGCSALPLPGAGTPTPFTDISRWNQLLAPAELAIQADPDHFSGSSNDDSNGWWRLHIWYLPGFPEARAKVEALIPTGAPVEWTEARFSMTERLRVFHEINIGDGSWITSVSIGTPDTVQVGIVAHDAVREAAFRSTYGEIIEFVVTGVVPPL